MAVATRSTSTSFAEPAGAELTVMTGEDTGGSWSSAAFSESPNPPSSSSSAILDAPSSILEAGLVGWSGVAPCGRAVLLFVTICQHLLPTSRVQICALLAYTWRMALRASFDFGELRWRRTARPKHAIT